MRPGERVDLPVARYLRPEEEVVPFRARPELDELLGWCVSGAHAGIRLVTGNGGAGKTRLALRLGEELEASGWQQLWVKRGSERAAVADVHEIGEPCVLVVDYAETRSGLVGLLDDVAADEDGPDLRVVLLARSAGEWWQQLLVTAEELTAALLEACAVVKLGPVRAAGGSKEVFDDAVTAFAQKVGIDRPDAPLALSDPDPVVLVVHAAALLAVADYAAGVQSPHQAVSGSEVLEALLRHEARYWARTAASRGLDLDLSVLRLAVAAGNLIGADSETAAGALLARIPDLDLAERRGRVARWLHDLYPVAHEDVEQRPEWLGPLRPDRIAEQLIASELTRRPELIAPLVTGLSEARGTRALTVLARVALTQDRAIGLLRNALAADLDHLAVPALSVAIETSPIVGELLSQAIASTQVSQETLVRLAEKSPYPSLAVAAPAAAVYQRLADDSTNDNERAGFLMSLSNRLGDLGRPDEALATVEQAVAIYRQLAEARPDAFLPDLAGSLNNKAGRLGLLGRWDEALATVEQAVAIYRQLAEARPDAFLPYLALSLNNQSVRLGDLGRLDEALTVSEQAVAIYRQLAEARPDAFLRGFALSLNNQSVRFAQLGRPEEALTTVEEAVAIYRQLAEAQPDAFLPDLARALDNQSSHLAGLGRPDEALTVSEQAVAIYRQLAEARPEAFLPYVAQVLNNQSLRLVDLGRPDEALTASEQAVAIYRQLAEARPEAFLPNLAHVLENQSSHLLGLGRREEAMAAMEQAVAAYRQLAGSRPAVFVPRLVQALESLADQLSRLNRVTEAWAIREEADAFDVQTRQSPASVEEEAGVQPSDP